MGLPPYKSSESSVNRRRSSSHLSPIRNRILYHEVYSMGPRTLVRSYSCDQVFDKDRNGRPFQTTQIRVSSFITPEKNNHVNHVESERKRPRLLAIEYPTMSDDSIKKSTVTKLSFSRAVVNKTMIFTLLSAYIAYAFYCGLYRECNYTWDLERTEIELKENVFGQDEALAQINLVLRKFNSSNDVYIMVFTGGVGVGKTYVSSIISKNFPWSSNRLITFSEYFTTNVEKLINQKLSTCGCNLVIVDDLSVKTTKEAISLIMLLNKKRQEKENLLYILLFQTHTNAERSEIIAEFADSYFNIYHIPFKSLSRDIVEMCYTSEVKRQQIKVTKSELQKLVENKMKYIDVVKGPSGCKGVADDVCYYRKNLK